MNWNYNQFGLGYIAWCLKCNTTNKTHYPISGKCDICEAPLSGVPVELYDMWKDSYMSSMGQECNLAHWSPHDNYWLCLGCGKSYAPMPGYPTPIECKCGHKCSYVPDDVIEMWYESYRGSMVLLDFVRKLGL